MKENRFDIPELVDFCNKNGIYIYFNDVSTEGFSLEELSAQELEELSMYYKKNNRKGHNYISIHNYISFSNLIKKVDYLKGQREQKAYMNETIPCTRDEFVEMISTIISEDESIDIKEAKYLVDYIPENFLIKRSEYLYIKNEMKIDSIKNFISQSKEKQMEHLNKILHI